jgi:arylsulfatase A-like enzyme
MRPLSFRFAVLASLALATAALAADRPNIVLILADDLGWADLGCYGSKLQNTPRLDTLARQGARFTDAACAQPICSPSRAALLTGLAPARLGLTEYIPGRRVMPSQKLLRPEARQQLPLEELTLAERLKPAGYATACIGKWHLGGKGFTPRDQGFDEAFDAPGQSTPSDTEGGKSEFALTTRAEKFIDDHRAQPFFLYLAHHTPHIALAAKSNLVAKYKDAPNPTYAAMMETMDECVGRILDKLDQHGLATNTIVLFTSDNGGLSVVEGANTPATSNTPWRAGKGHLYEGGLRVPLLVRWPGRVPAGRVLRAPVVNTDFVPTLLELCRLPAPERTDGASFAGLLRGGAAPAREAIYWHYPHYPNQKGVPSGAMRAGDWKFLEFFETGHVELYHLASDPGESLNLAASEPGRVREMRSNLAAWRERMGAQMPAPNPGYDPEAAWTTVTQQPNGAVHLAAAIAEVHGERLRYEPPANKNTLGYWTRAEDWARWDFEIEKPGRFTVELLQGCGPGSGGAEVEVSIHPARKASDAQRFRHVVEDTGHFQNFVVRVAGTAALETPGRYTLTVKPRSRPGPAVMDLRAVTLRPMR